MSTRTGKKPTHSGGEATKKKAETLTEHKLFPVQFRTLATKTLMAEHGCSADDAEKALEVLSDEDIRELGEGLGVNEEFPAGPTEGDGSGVVNPSAENGDVGEQPEPKPMRGPLQNIIARLANIDPAVKKMILDGILKLIGIKL